jgi:hypothetical protein
MIHCENCDSPSVVVDLIDTESFENEEGEYYYRDLLVYTCQDCGFSWEEFSDDYI